ncbi:MAG: hypothetical protein COB96_01580 [Planctomycetota bacterium]|nr:MAG: hypothetical protein COB96_01580 [Planctomycetota bacterium]
MSLIYERQLAGATLRNFAFDSAVLRNNPMGDPTLRDNPLLVPEQGAKGLPLVVMLVGFTGFGQKVMSKSSLWGETLPERLARATAAGDIPPAVYLWPSCETRLGGSQYMNSSATGRYQDYLIGELVPAVEAELGCGGSGSGHGRHVAGKSSGGYGALTLAMRNPGFFDGCASHAGDMGFDSGYRREFPEALSCWRRHGGPAEFLAALHSGEVLLGSPEHAALDALAMASCYSPNPDSELGFDLPVNPETGEPNFSVWERWLACDPLFMVEQEDHAAALRQLDTLYLDAGESDEFALQWGLRRFIPQLEKMKVPHHAEFFSGGHFNIDHRYETSLPLLLKQ